MKLYKYTSAKYALDFLRTETVKGETLDDVYNPNEWNSLKSRSSMKLLKSFFSAAMVMSFSVICRAGVSTNVVNKLIDKGEYAIAAEVLSDGIDAEMSRADIDGMIVWIEKLAAKLRGGDASLSVKKFVPPDPDEAYEKIRAEQPWWGRWIITIFKGAVSWKNDAQRVVVMNWYVNQTTLLSADEAQKELARFDAMKNSVEALNKVVSSRCKIEGEDWDHYNEVKSSISSIKERLKTNRTRFLSYDVVSPYLYEAHCHLFVGIADDWRVSSFNKKYPKDVEAFKTKGVKLLAKACHKDWLYSCSQDVRDQFLEIQRFVKENVAEREYEEYKVIQTLSNCNDPSKVRSADYWWK